MPVASICLTVLIIVSTAEVRPRECDNPKPMFRPSAANRPIQKPAPQQTRQLTHDPMVRYAVGIRKTFRKMICKW